MEAWVGQEAMGAQGVVGLIRVLDGLLAWGRLPDARASVPSYLAQSLEGEGRTILATFKSPCSRILLNFQKVHFGDS